MTTNTPENPVPTFQTLLIGKQQNVPIRYRVQEPDDPEKTREGKLVLRRLPAADREEYHFLNYGASAAMEGGNLEEARKRLEASNLFLVSRTVKGGGVLVQIEDASGEWAWEDRPVPADPDEAWWKGLPVDAPFWGWLQQQCLLVNGMTEAQEGESEASSSS